MSTSVWLCYGKGFSPNFASIYVAELEEAALSKSLLYLTYLDAILIIWSHSTEEFCKFF